MTKKQAYGKPTVVSNRVFSLTSNGCDVLYGIPDPCGSNMMWGTSSGICRFIRKSPDPDTCLEPPINPIFKS